MNIELILLIIGILALGIVFGFFLGRIGANLKKSMFERKLGKDAGKVIKGEKKNQYVDENGKVWDVNRFIIRGEDGKERIIDLTGKEIEKDKDFPKGVNDMKIGIGISTPSVPEPQREKKENPWTKHLKEFRKKHPELSVKQIMKEAKKTYTHLPKKE